MTIDTTHLDADADKVKQSRPAILAMAQLLNTLLGSSGAGQIGHDATLNYVAGTIGAVLNDVCLDARMFPWLAKGDGVTDDTAAIQAAIDYLESKGGGTVRLPAGTFLTTDTLTSDNHGVMLVGAGEGMYYGNEESITVQTPATTIKYTGAAGSPVIHFTCTAGQYKKVGGGLEKVFLHCGDGAGLANYGLLVTSRDKLTVRNVTVFNPTAAQLRTECYAGVLGAALSGYDVQHCLFENITGAVDDVNNTTGKGLQLTGGQGNGGTGQGNTSFNTFVNTRWQSHSTKPAVEIGDTDNNTFVALRANGGGVGTADNVGAVEFLSADQTGGGVARYNNIFGCEAVGGVIARASQTGGASSFRNNIFGYNISNGGVAPNIEAGAGGSADATLTVYYTDRIYAPADVIVPTGGTISFDAQSAAIAHSRDVAYSKVSIAEHGNLAAGSVTVQGSTVAGSATYSVAAGTYTRVGRLTFVEIVVTWSGHTGTGNTLINGLPFPAFTASNRDMILGVRASNFTFSGQLVAATQSGSKQLVLQTMSSGAAVAGVPMDAAGTLHISGCYQCE